MHTHIRLFIWNLFIKHSSCLLQTDVWQLLLDSELWFGWTLTHIQDKLEALDQQANQKALMHMDANFFI